MCILPPKELIPVIRGEQVSDVNGEGERGMRNLRSGSN